MQKRSSKGQGSHILEQSSSGEHLKELPVVND